MTTIVCNKEEIACDLQFTEGSLKWKGKTKIYKFPPHPNTYPVCEFIVGFAGLASDIISVAEYFSLPETTKPPKPKDLRGLVLTANGDIYAFDNYDKWILMNQPFAAIGSGGAVALGAMESGHSPREAIRIASKYDAFTGLGIKVMSF